MLAGPVQVVLLACSPGIPNLSEKVYSNINHVFASAELF